MIVSMTWPDLLYYAPRSTEIIVVIGVLHLLLIVPPPSWSREGLQTSPAGRFRHTIIPTIGQAKVPAALPGGLLCDTRAPMFVHSQAVEDLACDDAPLAPFYFIWWFASGSTTTAVAIASTIADAGKQGDGRRVREEWKHKQQKYLSRSK